MSDARDWLNLEPMSARKMRDALLAVLDLHEQHSNMGDQWCVHDGEDWPCDTVRTIDKALGVTDE